jgi:uncharacterized RDD family membrane protein YckC
LHLNISGSERVSPGSDADALAVEEEKLHQNTETDLPENTPGHEAAQESGGEPGDELEVSLLPEVELPLPFPDEDDKEVRAAEEGLVPEQPLAREASLHEHEPLADKYALILRRFLASVLDISVIISAWLLFYMCGHRLLWKGDGGFFAPLLDIPQARGGFYLLMVLISLAYFILFHYSGGQTPGKILTKIRLISCDTAPLSLSQVLLRTCGGFISVLCLGIGYLAIFWSIDERGWNDKLAGTCVEVLPVQDKSTDSYA